MSSCSLKTFSELIIPQFLLLKFKKVRNSKPLWKQCSIYPADFRKEALSSEQRWQGVRCSDNLDHPGRMQGSRGADSSGNWLLLLTKQKRKNPRPLFQHLAELKVKYKERKPKKPTQLKPLVLSEFMSWAYYSIFSLQKKSLSIKVSCYSSQWEYLFKLMKIFEKRPLKH